MKILGGGDKAPAKGRILIEVAAQDTATLTSPQETAKKLLEINYTRENKAIINFYNITHPWRVPVRTASVRLETPSLE